jgi:hypothetical protein
MDVSDYRKKYEAELASKAAAASKDGPRQDLDEKVRELLATLRNAKAAPAARDAALNGLKTASFLGTRFARHHAEFIAALREVARDSNAELRQDALEVLALDKDAQAQDLLRRGLMDPKAALVSAAKALQFLGFDDHAGIAGLARQIFDKTDDLATKEEALRALVSDPSSANLFANLLGDKSQPRSLRAISATGLHALNPSRFAEMARAIVTDSKDYEDIRATALGALTHAAEHLNTRSDQGFVDRVRQIAAETPLANLRAAAGKFMNNL